MRLDGALAEEESGGDLAVRAALGDEGGDSPLGLRELAAGGCAPPDPSERRQSAESRKRVLTVIAWFR